MIEVCSKHTGKILVPIAGEAPREVEFLPRGPFNVAEVDEQVADVLLGQIGGTEYFKAPAIDVTGAVTPTTPDGDKTPEPPGALPTTVDGLLGLSVAKLEAAVADITDGTLLMETLAAETQSQNRQGALKVLQARLDALA